jgi:hypothetical protein
MRAMLKGLEVHWGSVSACDCARLHPVDAVGLL